ncbi:Low molecular weight protein tyrosine phosphatase [Helicobacter heilmannii]|uniref:protein-tyrosine-phosphatase n=1 Tax=Helicobacter heilmannii TaxID=35817 RepID=A0A0K2XWI4_HELHE|nr:low molecular weight protein-tyrosine-phosphatase [Helicobacter heilmannii]BDQ27899.1 phosphotyrosine protein phosphatase [Helicobacter heilmannii]CCM10708.1 Low molecular weight protein tyrosine phosphatase [Helicobacter heilmannii ASB1.4]CRF49210.1 Low molecular weight protein tyrosine phosphatase [Helicobacter heilmannii]CRI35258.1 Low molecular weight protein tyrosine phosphatase [Helicobacter heilmannii]
MSLLFLCLGNICRSMLARGIATDIINKRGLNLIVDGAGISNYHEGEQAHPPIIALAKRHGIDLTLFASKPITQELANKFDCIVAMDESNVKALKDLGISHPHVCKLGDFGLQRVDIPDPYTYTDPKDFEKVYALIELGVQNLLDGLHV